MTIVLSNITTIIVIVWTLLISTNVMIIPATVQESHALKQVAGNITVNVEPGQTKSFTWGLLNDKDELNAVNISADGTAAGYISYPKTVDLTPGKARNVQSNVSIPFDHPGNVELNATLRATAPREPGNITGGMAIVNVEMGKRLFIVIDQNPFPEFRELIFKPYKEKIKISDKEFSIPINSTSNVTDFSFNQNNRSISFNVTGYAGTNGTTVIYPASLLEAPYFVTFDGKAFTEYKTVTNNKTGEKGVMVSYPHDTMHDNFALAASRILIP